MPVAVLIWAMVYPMMVGVDFVALRQVGDKPKGLVVTLVVNWLIKPFTMAALGVLFFNYVFAGLIPPDDAQAYLAGVILLGAAPCTAMVFVWSNLTRGDATYTLVQVSVNDHDSVEADDPRLHAPNAADPICWTQVGYASGYAREFFDKLIVYKELSCSAQGHPCCRVIGKPADLWAYNDPDVILFRNRIATAAPQGRRQAPLNALKPGHRTALLTPIQAQLDRAAKHNFPLLFSGPCGSGRLLAAQYLHEMAHAEGLSPLTLSAADLTPQMLSDAMQPPPRTTRKTAPPPILILNRIEKMAQQTQDRLLTILRSPDAVNLPRIVALTMSSPEMIRHRDGLQDGLWHRLMVDHIRFPALADRAADIPAVAVETLTILAHRLNMTAPTLTESAARYLSAQRWPANLHELESVLLSCLLSHSNGTHLSETELRDHHNQATAMATVGPQDPRFADWLTEAMAAGRISVSEIEERIYAAALSQERGNMAAAARLVGLTRAQLAYRIKQSDDQADGARTKS